MRQTCNKLFSIIIISFILITCTACNNENKYTKKMFLEDVMSECGMNFKEVEKDAKKWNLLYKETDLNTLLNYRFVVESFAYYLNGSNQYKDQLTYLKKQEIINEYKSQETTLNQEEALIYIDSFKDYIDNQSFDEVIDYDFKDKISDIKDYEYIDGYYLIDETYDKGEVLFLDNKYYTIIDKKDRLYKLEESSFEDLIDNLYISGGNNINLEESTVIEEFTFENFESIYSDDGRISKDFKTRVAYLDGYRLSYELGLNKIRIHISKKLANDINIFFETDIHGINPQFKWNYKKGKLDDSYFRLAFNTSESFGISNGKYKKYYIDSAGFNKKDFFNSLKNVIKPKNEVANSSFKLFTIKTPIPNIPTANIEMAVYLNFSINGKIEINIETNHNTGFEIKNGNFRFINNHDLDSNLQANASATSSINLGFGLNALTFKLADILFKAGIRAKVQPTLHMFVDNEVISEQINTEYDLAKDAIDDKDDFKLCGDVSFNWLFEVELNSDSTVASRFGLKKSKSILNENNQILGNMSHIENGMFVEDCTVKNRINLEKPNIINKPDNIILEKMSLVLKEKEFKIPISRLPKDLSMSDIKYEVKDESILRVDNHHIIALKAGSTSIRIFDKDNKYEVFLNVLVSYDVFKTIDS